VKYAALALAALFLSTAACAEDAPPATSGGHVAGANAPLEADFQLGTFTGGRLKGTVYKGQSFTMEVEGLYGRDVLVFSPFTDGAATAWGGGIRFNHPLSNGSRNVWLVSPGIDFYDADSHDAAFVSPNVDLSWVHEFSSHFGLVLGFKGGVQVGLSGHSDSGESYSGQTLADLGIYLGARF
jgi:hypothetical protein